MPKKIFFVGQKKIFQFFVETRGKDQSLKAIFLPLRLEVNRLPPVVAVVVVCCLLFMSSAFCAKICIEPHNQF